MFFPSRQWDLGPVHRYNG